MKDLKELIIKAKHKNETAMLKILEKFEPSINKYFRWSGFDEDVRSELNIAIIDMVYKIDLSKLRSDDEYTLISYIWSTVYHKYIRESIKRKRISNAENYRFDGSILEQFEYENYEPDKSNEIILDSYLKDVLTEKEYYCITELVLHKQKATEIAEELGITKQAVGQCKKRAIEKIKKFW